MLRWAFGYLAMAVVAAIGFASLQGSDGLERRSVSTARDGARSARAVPAPRDEAADESAWEEASVPDEDSYSDDEGYSDEGGYSDDEGASDEEAGADDDADLEYVIEAGAGGHFLIEAVVNGAPVDFLVDTGASDIVLTLEDAERLGLPPETLRFTQRFATANGVVRGAPVVLREIRIGQFSLFDVPASVNEAPLRVSLLGMSFLKRLNGYEVDDGRLTLRW